MKKSQQPYFYKVAKYFFFQKFKVNFRKKIQKKLSNLKMKLKFLGNKCSQPESIFSFLINFMLSHSHAFDVACNLCPFGYCYKYFIGSYAAFQIVSLILFNWDTQRCFGCRKCHSVFVHIPCRHEFMFISLGVFGERTVETFQRAARWRWGITIYCKIFWHTNYNSQL